MGEVLDFIGGTCMIGLSSASLQGQFGETVLHIGAACGHLAAVRTLLEIKANPDVQDGDGETPLHYATLRGQVETARLLLRAKATVDLQSHFSETPTDIANQKPETHGTSWRKCGRYINISTTYAGCSTASCGN